MIISWKPNKKTLEKIKVIIEHYGVEGHMTLRRTYYILVGKHFIKNSRSSYQQLSRLFKKARINGLLPYKCIVDSTREIKQRATYSSFQECFDEFTEYFRRDSMQDQKVYLEVWLEKDAIANVIYPITYHLDIPLVVSKGFTSVTFKEEAARRFEKAAEKGKKVIVLFVSDFDAEGEYIPKVLKNNLIEEHKCTADFDIKKVLLSHNDVKEYKLLSNVDYFIKPQQKKKAYVQDFINKYGEVQYELDALPSNVLKSKVKQAILEFIDEEIAESSDENSEEEVAEWKKVNLIGDSNESS